MDIVISITIKQLLADDISRYMHTLIIIIIIIVIVVIVVIIVILVIITVITNGGEFASSSRKCFDCAEKPQPVKIWGLNTDLISADRRHHCWIKFNFFIILLGPGRP